MKHFFLTRPSPGYGEFHMLLVAATDETEARLTAGRFVRDSGFPADAFTFVDPEKSTAKDIGEAHSTKTEVVMSKAEPE